MLTKEHVVHMLMTDDRWLARALLALSERQTADERREEMTKYHNRMGFRPCHAKRGTNMADFYRRTGFLTPRQKAWWRAAASGGQPRIAIYANQLIKVAGEKKGVDNA
jgi:hypothetical protein